MNDDLSISDYFRLSPRMTRSVVNSNLLESDNSNLLESSNLNNLFTCDFEINYNNLNEILNEEIGWSFE